VDKGLLDKGQTEDSVANLITVTLRESVDLPSDFPIQILDSRLLVRGPNGRLEEYGAGDGDLGVVFVRPLKSGSLELVVWGRSSHGLAQAARLTPLTTGIGQPDFVILEGSSKWKGVEGTSLGFFDAHWNITSSSVMASSGHKVK